METKFKQQWEWVVISRLPRKVSRSTCNDYGIQVFMEGFAGARIFFSDNLAREFRALLKSNIKIGSSYDIRIVPDEEFMEECDVYLKNKFKR